MQSMSELFEQMKEREKAKWCSGGYAERRGDRLVWTDESGDVALKTCIFPGWKPIKEEEKEIETEKWMRVQKDGDDYIRYVNSWGNEVVAHDIMCRKDFLRWVGTMPKEAHIPWPGDRWCLWFRSDEDGYHNEYYEEGAGYTIQVFAKYAEMRVEK